MNNTLELLIIVMLLGIMAEIYLTTRPTRKLAHGAVVPTMLVDTSVLMDGRVVDLAKTGFLLGQVVVPRSVLGELQLLADGSDHTKRERARFGMDKMKELKDVLGASFTLLPDEEHIPEGVDSRLLKLAKEMNASVLTIDYNLNKVAQVEGIMVLNINELAKSLRMSHLPGDTLELELTQKGQDSHQAVGHLRDGTMVVVEQAKKFIGQIKRVEIIRSLQTDAGKMMFAKIVETGAPTDQTHGRADAAPKQRSAGRKVSGGRGAQKQASDTPKTAAQKTPVSSQLRTRRTSTPAKDTNDAAARSPKQQQTTRSRRPKTSAQREAELIRLVDEQ